MPKELCGRYTKGPILQGDGIDLRGAGLDLIPFEPAECPDVLSGDSKMVCCAESDIAQRLCSDYAADGYRLDDF